MSNFLTKIHITKVFHLENIEIELDDKQKKHLILTGKNGSGKTSLLNSLVDFLQRIKDDRSLGFLQIRDNIKHWEQQIQFAKTNNNPTGVHNNEMNLESELAKFGRVFGNVEMRFYDIYGLSKKLQSQDFILAVYAANRKTEVLIFNTPEKPNLAPVKEIGETKIQEFIKFLVDLRVQEALARNENQQKAADEIKNWFEEFTYILQKLFEDDQLALDFNYRDYSFTINQRGLKFGFNQLAAGYSAIIDIIADLVIKMQDQNSLTRAYEKEGIVLIDEVETHLHLKLQRLIMPMLTQIFPNIQFIVTTHSPFVLSSLSNAIAFDLEKQIRLDDLTAYSYEALAEGYFNVETESGFLHAKLKKFKELAEIPKKDSAELAEYQSLDEEFAAMDDALASPNIRGQYLQIKLSAQ